MVRAVGRVGGWLRPAATWLKRRANAVTRGWDDVVGDDSLRKQIEWVATRLVKDDSRYGLWCVILWTDASAIATGVVVETPEGDTIKDTCWLRRKDSSHINFSEMDAAVHDLNLAIAWGMRIIKLRADSATVNKWIDGTISGRARLRTKTHGEMLIRRLVGVIRLLKTEQRLTLLVTLALPADNRADTLIHVPKGMGKE